MLIEKKINTAICSVDPHSSGAQGLVGEADMFPLVRGDVRKLPALGSFLRDLSPCSPPTATL